jgi:hypothetical protein
MKRFPQISADFSADERRFFIKTTFDPQPSVKP